MLFEKVQDFVLTFTSILWEAMPFIVLGAVVAGILEEFLPQKLITRIMPKRPIPAVLVGSLLGLIFPMCECGIVVVMRRLLRKGLPLASCVAYMLAGPILNVIVLGSTYVAFRGHKVGPQMMAYRAGFGFLVAAITGLIVYRLERKTGIAPLLKPMAMPPKVSGLAMVDDDDEVKKSKPMFQRINNVAGTSLHDFIDITVFLILGAIIAAIAKLGFNQHSIENMSHDEPLLAIPAMMILAVVMCLCSEADAFVAASFTKMAMSAKLAYLVLGPMLDFKLLMMYTRVFKLKLIVTITTCTVMFTFLFMVAFHYASVKYPNPIITWDWIQPPAITPTDAIKAPDIEQKPEAKGAVSPNPR